MCSGGGGAVQTPQLAPPTEPLKNAEADADQAAARSKQRAAAKASLDSTFTARGGGSASVASGKNATLGGNQ